eukprot:TRINITY_DN13232_c0_g1_i1.p1 TRINITY_DN13232_c0_g1~~TRINITY_DN13232_c0_g1_i1.p1  ORF type:complete len:126 (-),score=19.09 TRINITY_DN13232_c0_g1_i1:131-484(-)
MEKKFLKSEDCYFKVKYEGNETVNLDKDSLKILIQRSMTDSFGELGGKMELEVIKNDKQNNSAIIWCKREHSSQIWSAIAMIYKYGNTTFRMGVVQTSSYLCSLSSSSRDFFSEIQI